MSGRGVYTWASGDRYDGEWEGNETSGRGILLGLLVIVMTGSGKTI